MNTNTAIKTWQERLHGTISAGMNMQMQLNQRAMQEEIAELRAALEAAQPAAQQGVALTEKDWKNIKLAMLHLKEAKFHTASDNLRDMLARHAAIAAQQAEKAGKP